MLRAQEIHSNSPAIDENETTETADDLQPGQQLINDSEAEENSLCKYILLSRAEKFFKGYPEDKNATSHRAAKLKLLEVYVRMSAVAPEESDLIASDMKIVLDQLPLDNFSDQPVTVADPEALFASSILSCYHAHYQLLLGTIAHRQHEASYAVSVYQEGLRYFQQATALLTRIVDSSKTPVKPEVSELIDFFNVAKEQVQRLISIAEQELSAKKTETLASPTETGLGLFADRNTIPADSTLTNEAGSPQATM